MMVCKRDHLKLVQNGFVIAGLSGICGIEIVIYSDLYIAVGVRSP